MKKNKHAQKRNSRKAAPLGVKHLKGAVKLGAKLALAGFRTSVSVGRTAWKHSHHHIGRIAKHAHRVVHRTWAMAARPIRVVKGK